MGSNPRPPLYESDTPPTAPRHTAAWYVFNWKIKHFSCLDYARILLMKPTCIKQWNKLTKTTGACDGLITHTWQVTTVYESDPLPTEPRCPYQYKKTTTLPPDYIRYETSMNTYLPSPWLQLSLLHSLYLQCIFISIKSYIRTFAFYRLLVSITVHDSWVDHQNN